MRFPPPFRVHSLRSLVEVLLSAVVFVGAIVSIAVFLKSSAPPREEKVEGRRSDASKSTHNAIHNFPGAGPLGSLKEAAEPGPVNVSPDLQPVSIPAPKCTSSAAVGDVALIAKEETPVWNEPLSKRSPLMDSSGKQIFLDPRHEVKILEKKKDWVRVAVAPPVWPPGGKGVNGWILEKDLKKILSDDDARCLFLDVSKWKAVPEAQRKEMHDVALRILREDRRCRRIAGGDYLAGGMRYYYTCYPTDGGKPYHHWLTANTQDKHFTPPAPIEDGSAMSLCRSELEKRLRNKAVIEGTAPANIKPEAFSSYLSDQSHRVTLEYSVDEGAAGRKAYCFVPPGGDAEVTLEAN